MKLRTCVLWVAAAVAAGGLVRAQDQGDPPSRVLRLNYLTGSVSFRPADLDDWAPATLNYPITTGDHLWTDRDAAAELHVGSNAVRMASETAVGIVNLDDRIAQVSVTDGSLNVRLRRLDPDESFEIDTPSGAISLLRPGDYRVDVIPDENSTSVTVRAGEAEVTGGGQAFSVRSGERGRFQGNDELSSAVVAAPEPDRWDEWCRERDEREERALEASARYVPREMIGAEDLGSYGAWRDDPEYGAVWVPAAVPAGWAPYRYGHWAYVEPWGWTWIDEAPWGFAPFHYGRWAYARGGWCWIPGAAVARPVYSPALVVFVGGRGFDSDFGRGDVAAWIPLGPREVYRPPYRVSETYVRRVNVTNVTNITNVNVTNVSYVNRTYVTAVPRTTFASARPVAPAAVRVPPAAVARVEPVSTIPFRPARESKLGRPVQPGARVAAPPARVIQRPVVARSSPPPVAREAAGPVRVAPPVREDRTPASGPAWPPIAPPRDVRGTQTNNERPQALPPRGNERPGAPNVPRGNEERTPAATAPQPNTERQPAANPPRMSDRPPAPNPPPPNKERSPAANPPRPSTERQPAASPPRGNEERAPAANRQRENEERQQTPNPRKNNDRPPAARGNNDRPPESRGEPRRAEPPRQNPRERPDQRRNRPEN